MVATMESDALIEEEPRFSVASVSSPRVLAVIPGRGEGASFIFARRQVESLAGAGINMEVFYLQSRLSLPGLLSEWCRLRRAIQRYSPDMIHAQYGTITSFLCACSSRRPLAVTFRGSDLNRDPSLGCTRARLGFLLSQLSAWRASVVICVSERLRAQVWWNNNKVAIVPSGVNLTLFRPMDKQQCRRTLAWEKDAKVILFNAGKAPLLKGLPLARESVCIAERALGPLQLFELCGEISPEQIPVYLNAADCLLLTSQYEGSPNILKEALACNLPVVSVDIGDAVERLKGVTPSCIVDRDPNRIAKALINILCIKSRSNGRERIADLSEARMAERLCSIYNTIVSVRERAVGTEVSRTVSRS